MNDERKAELLAKLRGMDSQRVKFYDAKERLLSVGYSDTEIADALYSFSYDGIPNASVEATQAQVDRYYTERPEEAREPAMYLIKQQNRMRKNKLAVNYLASQYAPDIQTRNFYSVKFADGIGYPIFTAFLLTIPAAIVVIKYDLPLALQYVPFALVTIYWLLQKLIRS